MSEQPLQIRSQLSLRDSRKELLMLACALDRAGWKAACRPTRSPGAQFAGHIFGYVETFSEFLPGRLGRWLRGASFLTNIGRHLGWLRF